MRRRPVRASLHPLTIESILGVADLARVLHVSAATIYRWKTRGGLPPTVGPDPPWQWRWGDVQSWRAVARRAWQVRVARVAGAVARGLC